MTKRTVLRPAGLPAAEERTYGIRYGNWVFVSAIMATDFRSGLAPQVHGNPAIPLAGEEVTIRETKYIYKTIQAVLATAGTDIQKGVRIDQFPVSRNAVDPYHVARKNILEAPRPASTSVDILGLLSPDASIQVEMIAIVPAPGFEKEGIKADQIPQPLAGYSPAIRAGDFVFLAGQVPTDWKSGIAPEARVDPNFWEGSRIERETRYILKNMALTLEAAGSSMPNVVKAQVYLTNINDLPRLDRIWREAFPKDPPARTIYPVRSLGVTESCIEINFVGVADNGKTRKDVVSTGAARRPIFHESQAIRAGEFLFLSGLMAADESGLVDAARINPGYPYESDSAAVQMDDIMTQAQAICRAAGTDLSRALRMLNVHTDLNEYYRAAQIRRRFFTDGEPASATILVAAPFQIPGCSIMADLWVAMEA
jgi:enamine deaminase RidA (YjgF/YER057c/UK114 family)